MKEIKYIILYCVFVSRENFSDTILLRFRNRNYLRFRFQIFDKSRFWFHTANGYGYGYGYGHGHGHGYGYGSLTLDSGKSRFSKEVSQKLPEPFQIGLNRNTDCQFFYFA